MTESLPFMNSTGLVNKILDKIISAQTPTRYSQDFQTTKLGYGSGSAKAFIPLLKRVGFLSSDGTPTEIYKQFRNSSLRGEAMAEAIKSGYAPLYAVNEYAHDLEDKDLKDAVIQVTGHDKKSSTVNGIVGTFKALCSYANFDNLQNLEEENVEDEPINNSSTKPVITQQFKEAQVPAGRGMNLSYTINLNLPETKDPEVFNAIFKSLKENLLD